MHKNIQAQAVVSKSIKYATNEILFKWNLSQWNYCIHSIELKPNLMSVIFASDVCVSITGLYIGGSNPQHW